MEVTRLHIGGKQHHPDWKILDVEPRPEVDYVGNATNLSHFNNDSIDIIYASHVLEHFYYNLDNELVNTLKEWYRVLKPGGKVLISVPDLKTLCWLYLHPNMMPIERHHLMRVIFGGQTNVYDIHKVGFDFEIMIMYLEEAGFTEYEQVSEFNLFDDCSRLRILDTLISLNVIAKK
jgi:predicted SAM-dependent methyltransferase